MKTHKKTQNKKQTSNNTLARVKPRFPIEFWSVYERVLKNQPRTNNHVETWHSAIKGDVRKNMNLFKVLELLQNEQSNTENCRKYIERGDNIRARPSRKDQKREERIEKLVKSYAIIIQVNGKVYSKELQPIWERTKPTKDEEEQRIEISKAKMILINFNYMNDIYLKNKKL